MGWSRVFYFLLYEMADTAREYKNRHISPLLYHDAKIIIFNWSPATSAADYPIGTGVLSGWMPIYNHLYKYYKFISLY